MAKLGAFTCLSLLFAFAQLVYSQDCVYVIHIKTGDVTDAGTDATISLTLYDAQGNSVTESNLWKMGIMESGHDYFEKNSLDMFSIKGKCLASKVCKIKLSNADETRRGGWYVEYVKVSTNDFHNDVCTHTDFHIDEWLSKDEDTVSFTVYQCYSSIDALHNHKPLN